MDSEEIKQRLIRKMIQQGVVGAHKKQKRTVTSWFPSRQRKIVEKSIEELLKQPNSPLESVGGRDSIQLTSMEAARGYLQSVEGSISWELVHDTDREQSDSSTADSSSDLQEQIRVLEDELGKMDEAAKDWRSEARRRQRTSILVGVCSFILGAVASGVVGYFL
ncbi:hypothetical protein [Halorussus amylolyticus]|uniref:hypothetical protein n=1 Tax=Halorussus amylolyticus TaxID=1126242 RepID=UPI0010499F87|nr:hypothetical protein [Halorussus amylolyticus]